MGTAGKLQESEALTAVSLNGLTRVKSPGVWWPNSKLNITMPEEEDIPLDERCRRVNRVCSELGRRNVCLVSIHVNAAGRGDKWMNASGWCCYTSRGQTLSDDLATRLCEAAKVWLPRHRLRTDYSDGDPDFEAGFYILNHTMCPAVLTENLFQDSKAD